MNRGDIYVLGEQRYLKKPRPVIIIQSDRYNKDESVVTVLVTSESVREKEYRIKIKATKSNGLKKDSFVMIDKIVSIPREKLAKHIGKIGKKTMQTIHAKLVDFLSE
jgi:mRNA interferase MazF